MLTDIGKKLRAIRIDRDELLYDMSQKLGMSPADLSSIEHGEVPVPDDLRSKIKSLYNVDLDKMSSSHMMIQARKRLYQRIKGVVS